MSSNKHIFCIHEHCNGNHMVDFKSTCKRNSACTHGMLKKVAHKRRKLAQGEIQTLLDLMTMMFDENMHKRWDPGITSRYIVFLMVCLFAIMQHIQWDPGGRDNLHFHKFIHEEKWFNFMHGKSYSIWTQYSLHWWVGIFHESFGANTKQCREWSRR